MAALAVANLIKRDVLTWDSLAARKDSLDAASSAIGILVIMAGAVLSYFRFFHGRTFSTRAELDLVVRVYPLPNHRLLHTISLSLKNVGASAIWNPQPVISVMLSDENGNRDGGTIDRWFDPLQPDDGTLRASVIDTGEMGRFPTKMTFDPSVWTVTYMASVTCDSGDVWKHVHIVRNLATDTKDE